MKYLILAGLFSFRRCCMHLQSYSMRAGGQILWKKAEPNHQRIADDWFCNFLSWHISSAWLHLSIHSCKQWKEEVTKRTLAGVQRPRDRLWLLEIYPNTNFRSAVEWLMARNNRPLAPYSCKTFQSLSRGTRLYAFSRSTKHAKRSLPYYQDFSEICFRAKVWVRCAATRTKTTLTIFQFWFHYFSAFPFKAFGIYFPWQTKKWYPSVVCTLFAISFLEYRNNHTCLPISEVLANFPRNLTHSC